MPSFIGASWRDKGEAFNKGLLGLNVHARQYEVALLVAGLAFICIGVATLAGFIQFGSAGGP
jgi:hypothetical protein